MGCNCSPLLFVSLLAKETTSVSYIDPKYMNKQMNQLRYQTNVAEFSRRYPTYDLQDMEPAYC